MKKILICTFLFCLLGCRLSFANANQPLDTIAAVVNDDVITTSELNHAMELVKLQLFQEKASVPDAKVLQKKVLDELINKKLQLQLATQAGIKTTDAELNAAISGIAKQNNISVDDLYQRLNQEGMKTNDYRNEMRDQMTLHHLQQAEVINRIHITPQEIKSFMNSNLWQDQSTQEYHIEDLLVPLPDAPTPAQVMAAKKEARALAALYTPEQKLSALAKKLPAGTKVKVQTGDLGWRKMAEIPSIFSEQVQRMKAQEISEPIHAPNGFHVIRLSAVRSSNPNRANLNSKQVENLVMQRKFEQGVEQWLSKLRSTAFIVINDA